MKCLEHKNKYEVIFIEVKIPKEIRSHKESIFFGLSARQFACAVLAVGLAAGTYLGLGGIVGKEAASWLVLPPGAAQRSATRIPGCTSSSAAGAEALGSCA